MAAQFRNITMKNVQGIVVKSCALMLSENEAEWHITNYSGRHSVGQFVEALPYTPEGRGFDSRWCNWNFSLT